MPTLTANEDNAPAAIPPETKPPITAEHTSPIINEVIAICH